MVLAVLEKNTKSILVDMCITRLCVENNVSEYTIADEFKIVKGNLVRNSFYNFDMKEIIIKIDDEEMKGRLK